MQEQIRTKSSLVTCYKKKMNNGEHKEHRAKTEGVLRMELLALRGDDFTPAGMNFLISFDGER